MIKRCIAALLTLVLCLAPTGALLLPARAEDRQPRAFANLVLFAYFRDEPDKDYFNAPSAQPGKSRAQALMELYDGEQGRSFRQYMNTISGGQFRVHNLFPQWDGKTLTACELPFTHQQAQSGSMDSSILTELVRQLPELQGQTLDYDGDGCIDNLSVVLLGKADNATGSPPSLYPHQNTLPAGLRYSGKEVADYNMLNTDRLLDSAQADGSGLICHEFLHTLGYPDLYARDGSVPVGTWDIMAFSSRYPSWPLAYLRSHFTDWCQLPKLTASAQSISVSAPGEAGNQAYVIRSKRNPYEVFVVEMRRQNAQQSEDTLDARIGGTGLIVYRVDTTVDSLSNYFGSTGVYVFRPQPGQSGYVEGSERATVGNAFLSAESGRTSIGSADPNAGLAQGALTFSDGTNSGIVISDVSSAQSGTMTFSVTIPEADPQILWQDAQFPAHTGAALAQGPIRGQIMAAGYDLPYTGDQLQLYAFADPGWAPVTGEPLTQAGGFDRVTLTSLRDAPVVAWRASDGALYLSMLADGAWKSLGSLPDVDDYALTAQGGTLHLAYVTRGYAQAGYATITSSGLSRQGFCASGRMFGNPKAAVTGQGQVYLAFRDVTNNDDLLVYQVQDGGFSRLPSPGSASSYDLAAGSGGLLAALGGDAPVVKQLDGDSWKELARLDKAAHEPRLAFGADTAFLLAAPNGASAKDLRVYQLKDGALTPVGDRVDKGGDSASLTVFGDRLFTAYRMDGKAIVRFNGPDSADALLSLSVTPPALTSYRLGDSVSTQGLRVFANYPSGPKELAAGEYTLTGFDASQPGTRQATVTYQGMSASFSFTVFEAAAPTAQPTAEPTAVPTAEPTAVPTAEPTAVPTAKPTAVPTAKPTAVPSAKPTAVPTVKPTAVPSAKPTAVPSAKPTAVPSAKPTAVPSAKPTAVPSAKPTAVPSAKPTAVPSAKPTAVPSAKPTAVPAAQPTAAPAVQPTAAPAGPTSAPATPAPAATIPPSTAVIRPARPTAQPTAAPSASPSAAPTAVPTARPTEQPSPTPTPSNDSSADFSSGGVRRPKAALVLAGAAGACACGAIGLWFFFKRR